LTEEEKQMIINRAAIKYGEFLTELGVDWQNDPNSADTPKRVAKAYVYDLWRGRYEPLTTITAFPSDGYDGIVQESKIPLTSMCSHHHQLIQGYVSVAYVPSWNGKVVGLSKLNRIVEHFARRGAIQEQLTVAVHNAVSKICIGNLGVAVLINATHACVYCRGVKHQNASMQTAKLSGCFLKEDSARAEFYKNIELAL
jgi:GTP cyclohydrolase I